MGPRSACKMNEIVGKSFPVFASIPLGPQVASLEDTCSRQVDYINQLEEYANSLEEANAQLVEGQVRAWPSATVSS